MAVAYNEGLRLRRILQHRSKYCVTAAASCAVCLNFNQSAAVQYGKEVNTHTHTQGSHSLLRVAVYPLRSLSIAMATHPAIGLKGEQEFGTQKRSHGHSFVRLLSVGNQPQLGICKELHHKEGRTMFTVVVDDLRSFKVPANSMFKEI